MKSASLRPREACPEAGLRLCCAPAARTPRLSGTIPPFKAKRLPLTAEMLVWLVALVLTAGIPAAYILRERNRSHQAHEALERSRELGRDEPPSLHPVITDRCAGMGACERVCPEGKVIGLIRNRATLIDAARCIGHGECAAACPVDAIRLVFGTARRGVDLPEVGGDFQSTVRGIYVAGELGGMGLIRNAFTQGRQAVQAIAADLRAEGTRPGGDPDLIDLVIVGGWARRLECRPAGQRGRPALRDRGPVRPGRGDSQLPAPQAGDDPPGGGARPGPLEPAPHHQGGAAGPVPAGGGTGRSGGAKPLAGAAGQRGRGRLCDPRPRGSRPQGPPGAVGHRPPGNAPQTGGARRGAAQGGLPAAGAGGLGRGPGAGGRRGRQRPGGRRGSGGSGLPGQFQLPPGPAGPRPGGQCGSLRRGRGPGAHPALFVQRSGGDWPRHVVLKQKDRPLRIDNDQVFIFAGGELPTAFLENCGIGMRRHTGRVE
jgi:ferredoxin